MLLENPDGLEPVSDADRLTFVPGYSEYCFFHGNSPYCVLSTSSWLSTLSTPAMALALAATLDFSLFVFTGPRSVTSPFVLMTLTFLAIIESEPSFMIDQTGRQQDVILSLRSSPDRKCSVLMFGLKTIANLRKGREFSPNNLLIPRLAPDD